MDHRDQFCEPDNLLNPYIVDENRINLASIYDLSWCIDVSNDHWFVVIRFDCPFHSRNSVGTLLASLSVTNRVSQIYGKVQTDMAKWIRDDM